MNKLLKSFILSIGVFTFISSVVAFEKVLDNYPESFPSPFLFIMMFSGLLIYFYNKD